MRKQLTAHLLLSSGEAVQAAVFAIGIAITVIVQQRGLLRPILRRRSCRSQAVVRCNGFPLQLGSNAPSVSN